MKYGLIGEKLDHSYSPTIHRMLGNDEYMLCELSRDQLEEFFEKREFVGINVTFPYKPDAARFCDELSDDAKLIGSVNTVVNRDGRLYGYNTDTMGFANMAKRADISFSDMKVLILGGGGTSRTVSTVLSGVAKEIVVVSRSGENNYNNISKHSDADIIINTTPVGMYPNIDERIIDLDVFDNLSGVVDVIYNPMATPLISDAKERKIRCTGGLSMLVLQAVYSHELFFDCKVSREQTDEIISYLAGEFSNIILIGMPGSGKTTVGKLVAERLGRAFVDTDDLIARACGKPIPQIFADHGEEYFRARETEVLTKACARTGQVIAVGGGSPMRAENRLAMRRNGFVVYLDRDIERLDMSGRPLSSGIAALKEMKEKRAPIYENLGDIKIDSNRTPEDAAEEIISSFE